MKIALVILGVLVVIGLVIGMQLAGINNDLVRERNLVDQQFAQVDVALMRRADLIPNLVETVKGFAKQEQTVFGEIARARQALVSARSPEEKIAANNQVDTTLGRLFAVVEAQYPQLRSNENFLRLQDELAGTENRISVERGKYNERVTVYNTKIEVFPSNIVAGILGFQRKPLIEARPEKREAPQVKFGLLLMPAH